MTLSKRLPGLDLLRCLGLLFVVSIHFFLYNGFYYEPQVGAAMWAADSFRWLFFGCNGLFMMLTGYLMSQKEMTSRYYMRLLPLLISYTLTCLISYPIRHFVQGEHLTIWEWLQNFFSFSNYAWYAEMYIGLILFSPILNLALCCMQKKRELIGFAIVMLFLTAVPNLTDLDLLPDYWTGLYPITYYVIGAVIARLQPKVPPLLCLLGVAISVMGQGMASVLMTDQGFSEGFTAGYGGLWVTLTMTLLFVGLYRIHLPSGCQKIMAWASGGCFEGYILSRLLDTWLYSMVPQWHHPEKYVLLYICVTIPIFIFAVLAGKGTHAISQMIWRRINCRD